MSAGPRAPLDKFIGRATVLTVALTRRRDGNQGQRPGRGLSSGPWPVSEQPAVSLAMTMEHKDRPLVRVILTNTGSHPVKQRSVYITALLDSGADITIISEEDWPTDWPVMEAANPQIHGIGGEFPCEIPGYDRGGGY